MSNFTPKALSVDIRKLTGNYTVFNMENETVNPKSKLYLGEGLNVIRSDVDTDNSFLRTVNAKQIGFFWKPEEVDLTKDHVDFEKLKSHERHIFLSNLKYQTLLDSIQGRAPTILLKIVSSPELENWISTWSFFEGCIHAESYTYIMMNAMPTVVHEVMDDIVKNEAIVSRTADIASYYDDLEEYIGIYANAGHIKKWTGVEIEMDMAEMRRRIVRCIFSVFMLEAVRFYVSFMCSWAFAESKVMTGNAKIISLIARDEFIHYQATLWMMKRFKAGLEGEDFKRAWDEVESECWDMIGKIFEQERAWAEYLFQYGEMTYLNYDIAVKAIKYYVNERTHTMFDGKKYFPEITENPVPWVTNYLNSDPIQNANQEATSIAYTSGVKFDLGKTTAGPTEEFEI